MSRVIPPFKLTQIILLCSTYHRMEVDILLVQVHIHHLRTNQNSMRFVKNKTKLSRLPTDATGVDKILGHI